MKKNKNKLNMFARALILASFTAVLLIANVAKAGFGISPPYVSNDQLLRGMHYEQKISIGSDSIARGTKLSLDVAVPGANDWISIDPGKEIVFGDEKVITFIVKVDVPMDAQYKKYEGVITAKTIPPDLAVGGVALSVGGEIKVALTVTDQKINSFEIRSYKVPDISEGMNLPLTITIKNTGNVDIAPSKVMLDVYGSDKTELIDSLESTNIKNTIKPSKEGDIIAEIPTSSLKAGSYWAKLKIFNGNQIVGEYNLSLGILNKSEKVEGKEMGALAILAGMNKLYLYGGIALIILIILLILVRSMGKKKKIKKAHK